MAYNSARRNNSDLTGFLEIVSRSLLKKLIELKSKMVFIDACHNVRVTSLFSVYYTCIRRRFISPGLARFLKRIEVAFSSPCSLYTFATTCFDVFLPMCASHVLQANRYKICDH